MTDAHQPPSDSSFRPAFAGWLIIAAFFGGLGIWAGTAPLNGAVVAGGVVKVEGNRKSLQHLDGGIVRELRVKEGDRVKAGDVLIVLDDTQSRSELEILSEQYVVLRATEIRLLAELAGEAELVMPAELAARGTASYVRSIWAGQVRQFETRHAAIDGQRKVIGEKIRQLQSQIDGAEAQARSFVDQHQSVRAEIESLAPLVEKGLLPRARLLQLERTAFGLDGQIADARATIARFRQAIAEQELQVTQLGNERMAEITRDLRDIQGRLAEVMPRRTNAEAVLGRMEIRSPYGGRVVGLAVFSIGGVIQRGEKILDIVPDDDGLTIEVQVPAEDVSDLRPGARAEFHPTAFRQRALPAIQGAITSISADRLTDQRTGGAYFLASIRPDTADSALHPGMPGTVFIPTEQRTALDYLVGPLTVGFRKALR